MSLNNLVVFNRYLETTTIELLKENLQLFNTASNGAILLSYAGDNKGDFNESSMFNRIAGSLVRNRDPYGDGPIPHVSVGQQKISDVRVAFGTPVLEWTRTEFNWIKANPRTAAIKFAQQLSQDIFRKYIGVLFGSLRAALSNAAATNILNTTSETPSTISHAKLARGQQLFGDAMGELVIWMMHSKVWTDLFVSNLNNTERLFNYAGVVVNTDAAGRRILVSDNEQFVDVVPDPDQYYVYGLTRGAATLEQNTDWEEVTLAVTGRENIVQEYQAEWSANVSVKGFSWDQTNGGKAPTDAALFVNTNWDRYAVSPKNLPGVIVKVT